MWKFQISQHKVLDRGERRASVHLSNHNLDSTQIIPSILVPYKRSGALEYHCLFQKHQNETHLFMHH